MLSCSLWQVCFEIKGHLSQSFGLLLLTVTLKFCAELHLILTCSVLSAVPTVNWPCERVWRVVTQHLPVLGWHEMSLWLL